MENNINSIDEAKLDEILTVSATPHIRSAKTSQKIMLDVIIALVPALIASAYFFGPRALLVISVSVVTAVLSEYVFQKITKKQSTVADLSAVVTGILIAFNVPVNIPIYMIVFGSFFAIIVVKQLFGGIGSNFMNPALAGRAAIMASWPLEMGSYTAPHAKLGLDAVTVATPLAGGNASLFDAFIGNIPGTIGEVSALCLLIGAAYLLIKKVITLRIPLVYIISTVVMLFAFGTPLKELPNQVFYGGLILGAFFMATDYVTAPVSKKGQVVFAIGCGVITAAIRVFGSLPEGVSYSILVMNVASPLIEKLTTPKAYGKGGKK